MLFLISSAPDTQEFRTSYKTAMEMKADICLLQNAVYAARNPDYDKAYVLGDDMKLRGITIDEIKGNMINYNQLVDMMSAAGKVVGLL